MSVPITCDGRNGTCTSLAAKIEGGFLSIMHVHHGQKHVTRIALHNLLALTDKEGTLLSR